MIISRVPLRISFAGGGSDCRWFYKDTPGSVVSATISKYVTIAVYPSFSGKYILHYSNYEAVDKIDDIQNELVREILKLKPDLGPVEVVSMADVPGGTGLGSSSAFAVGLIQCLFPDDTPEELAQKACDVEIKVLGRPIGKQDQYAAAYGGFKHFIFEPNEKVEIEGVIGVSDLSEELMMFYTGATHDATDIHREISRSPDSKKVTNQTVMAMLAEMLFRKLDRGETHQVGEIMDKGWQLKKGMSPKVSTPQIDKWYDTAMKAGAEGGKLLGAGGGGFLLFHVLEEHQEKVKKALSALRHIPFEFTKEGAKIVRL